jgi:hypothetical protein
VGFAAGVKILNGFRRLNMKRRYAILPICAIAAVFCVSCSHRDAPRAVSEEPAAGGYGVVVGTKLPDNLAAAVSGAGAVPRQTGGLAAAGQPDGGKAKGGGAPKKIDEDLTPLSGTMLFAKVYDIMANPSGYMGKAVKIRGAYTPSFNSATGARYHYVMVSDASSCCKQGLEFIWSGKHAYPADYPAEGAKVEVAGVFKSYEEDGVPYYYLETNNITSRK